MKNQKTTNIEIDYLVKNFSAGISLMYEEIDNLTPNGMPPINSRKFIMKPKFLLKKLQQVLKEKENTGIFKIN